MARYAIGSRGSPDYYSRRKITVPPKETIPIERLLEGYKTALAQTGYSITTKLLSVKRAKLMIRRHLNAGLAYFDQTIINRYMGEIDDKYFKGNMQKKHYERTKREIDRFVSYVCTGRIDSLSSTLRGARQELTPKFEQIAKEFVPLCCWHISYRRNILRSKAGQRPTFLLIRNRPFFSVPLTKCRPQKKNPF